MEKELQALIFGIKAAQRRSAPAAFPLQQQHKCLLQHYSVSLVSKGPPAAGGVVALVYGGMKCSRAALEEMLREHPLPAQAAAHRALLPLCGS